LKVSTQARALFEPIRERYAALALEQTQPTEATAGKA
jgi:hypothetical protein